MTFKKMIIVVTVLLMVATVTVSAAAQEAVSKNKGTTTDPNAKKSMNTGSDAGSNTNAKTGSSKDASATPKVQAQKGKAIVKGIGRPDVLDSRTTNTGPVEDPPYLVPLDKAKSIVKAEFPDSKITSTERQYLTIKTKSSPPRLSSETGGNVSDMPPTVTPAYIFTIFRTDNKAVYQMTLAVDGQSGQIIPPETIDSRLPPGSGIPYNPFACHYNPKWGTYSGPGCQYLHPPED
jgi:hypothetical protein